MTVNLKLVRTACLLAALGMGSAAMAQSTTTSSDKATAAATKTHNEDALKPTPDNRVTAKDKKTPNAMMSKKTAPGTGPMEPQDKTVNRTDTKQ